MLVNSHPEMDESDLLDEDCHNTYQHLIQKFYSGHVQLEGLIFSSLFFFTKSFLSLSQ